MSALKAVLLVLLGIALGIAAVIVWIIGSIRRQHREQGSGISD